MTTSYVLVVRDPDYGNAFTIDGDVDVIDIDLGSSFVKTPDSTDDAEEWVFDRLEGLDGVPTSSPVYKAAIDTLSWTVRRYPQAEALIEAYEARRAAPPAAHN